MAVPTATHLFEPFQETRFIDVTSALIFEPGVQPDVLVLYKILLPPEPAMTHNLGATFEPSTSTEPFTAAVYMDKLEVIIEDTNISGAVIVDVIIDDMKS